MKPSGFVLRGNRACWTRMRRQ